VSAELSVLRSLELKQRAQHSASIQAQQHELEALQHLEQLERLRAMDLDGVALPTTDSSSATDGTYLPPPPAAAAAAPLPERSASFTTFSLSDSPAFPPHSATPATSSLHESKPASSAADAARSASVAAAHAASIAATAAAAVAELSGDKEVKIGKYTRAERQRKIARFKDKKTRRSFNKRIMYDCRKRFADTRPRVGGRFVSHQQLEQISAASDEEEPFQEGMMHPLLWLQMQQMQQGLPMMTTAPPSSLTTAPPSSLARSSAATQLSPPPPPAAAAAALGS